MFGSVLSCVGDDGGGLLEVGSGRGLADVKEGEDAVDVGVIVDEGELVAEVVVIWAKEEVGRISDRKRSVEENDCSLLEHPQGGPGRCLERMLICGQKIIFIKEGRRSRSGRLS
jgi:hypothetical protein